MQSTDLNTGSDWRQFFSLISGLLDQPDTISQCHLITETIEQKLSTRANLWLNEPFYPLPGEPPVQTLKSTPAPEIVKTAAAERKIQILTPTSNETIPYGVAIPLITQNNMLGILLVERAANQGFAPWEIDFLEGLSAHAAVAMQIARQVALKNWRYEQLTLVSKVSSQIANLQDLDTLFHHVAQLIQETFHYYYVAIFTLEKIPEKIAFRASASANSTNSRPVIIELQIGEGLIGHVAAQGEEIVANDVTLDRRYRFIDALPETQSEVCFPLKVENRVLGVLDVQSNKKNAFYELDVLVLRTLADNIALAHEGARLFNDLQYRAEQMRAVFEVSHALTSILDPDKLLREVVQMIHKRLGYPFVHLFTVHPVRRKIIYRAGSGKRSLAMEEQSIMYDLDSTSGLIPWAVRHGKTRVCNDTSTDSLYRPSNLPPSNTQSEMSVPLMFGSDVLGVLDIQSDRKNAFDNNAQSLFESLAANIATALRNANLYRSEQWRRQVADSFRDVAGLLSANVALDQLLDKILTELERNLPCDVSGIWLVDEINPQTPSDLLTLRLAAVHGVEPEKVVQARQNSNSAREWLDSSMTGTQPHIRQPHNPYGPLGAAMQYPADYSSIAAPLLAGGNPLGVLTLAHHSPGRFGSEALNMTATFASYAAVAIQNARLYAQAQEQAWVSTVLLQVAEATQTIDSIEELLNTVVRITPLLVGIKKSAIFLRENDGSFGLKAWFGFDPGDNGYHLTQQQPAVVQLLKTSEVVYILDAVKDLSFPQTDVDPEKGTMVLLPVFVRSELIGMFLITHQVTGQPGASQTFDKQTLSILQGITNQMSVAIENIRLIESREEEAYVTAVLLQVAQAVVSQNDLDSILETIVHLMPILVGIDTCIVYLWEEKEQVFNPVKAYAGSHQREAVYLKCCYKPGEFLLLDETRQKNEILFCKIGDELSNPDDWLKIPCSTAEKLDESSNKWLISFPIAVKGEVFGVMLIKEEGISNSIRTRRLEIINGVTQQMALSIQNEKLNQEMVGRELVEQEFQLARKIQQTFLPSHYPKINGWELHATWQTARQVGGDLYDIFRIGDRHLGLVIADVSDKGMPAALYMTVTRTLIRASAQSITSPSKVLSRVNDLLLMDSQNGMFVTAVYAILSIEAGQLTYANAGHNLPLVIRQSENRIETLPKGGMAMGVMKNSQYTDYQINLTQGDSVVFFTDGLTDTFAADGETFGDERLSKVLMDNLHLAAKPLVDAILSKVEEYRQDTPPGDDMTILVLHRNNPPKKLKTK
jgi:phosphoserine phosphatase RsbU/P